MQHDQGVVRQLKYRQIFRWLLLLRTFRAAVGPTRIFVALIGLAGMSCVDSVVDALPFSTQQKERHEDRNVGRLTVNFWDVVGWTDENRVSLIEPWLKIAEPAAQLLNRNQSWQSWAEVWTRLIGRVVVWTFIGGILVRLFAFQLGRDGSEGVLQAVSFVRARYVGYLTGPLLPILGVCLLCVPLILTASIFQFLGGFGEVIVALAMGAFAVLNLIAVLIIVGILAGWPLMVATVSVEGSDGFDGFSRAYSYVMNRPWQAGLSVAFGVIYGLLTLTFAAAVLDAVCYVGFWSTGIGLGHSSVDELVGVTLPSRIMDSRGLVDQLGADGKGIAGVVSFWAATGQFLLRGLQYSLFWAVVTVVYLLLRRSDDAIPMDEIFVPSSDGDSPVPVVGTAASELPVVERPVADIAGEPRAAELDEASDTSGSDETGRSTRPGEDDSPSSSDSQNA